MSFARSSLAAAEREASNLNVYAERHGSQYRYRAQRYPDGTKDVSTWPWGVYRLMTDCHRAGPSRGDCFVWKSEALDQALASHGRRFRR